jgi:hypothetical protein
VRLRVKRGREPQRSRPDPSCSAGRRKVRAKTVSTTKFA